MRGEDTAPTPEGLEVVTCTPDDEILVRWWDGTLVRVRNVAETHEPRDRYAVWVADRWYTDQILAPQMPGPDWSADPLGNAADAACAFANADGLLRR